MDAMNKATASHLSKIVSDLLQGLPKEYGAKVLGGTFDSNLGTLTIRVVIGPTDKGPEAWTPEYRALLELIKYSDEWMNPDGITKDMLERSINIPSLGSCKLIGFKARSQKFPYVVQVEKTGKQYKVNGRSLKLYAGLV